MARPGSIQMAGIVMPYNVVFSVIVSIIASTNSVAGNGLSSAV